LQHRFQLLLRSKAIHSSVLQGSGDGVRKGMPSTTLKPVEKGTAKELTGA